MGSDGCQLSRHVPSKSGAPMKSPSTENSGEGLGFTVVYWPPLLQPHVGKAQTCDFFNGERRFSTRA